MAKMRSAKEIAMAPLVYGILFQNHDKGLCYYDIREKEMYPLGYSDNQIISYASSDEEVYYAYYEKKYVSSLFKTYGIEKDGMLLKGPERDGKVMGVKYINETLYDYGEYGVFDSIKNEKVVDISVFLPMSGPIKEILDSMEPSIEHVNDIIIHDKIFPICLYDENYYLFEQGEEVTKYGGKLEKNVDYEKHPVKAIKINYRNLLNFDFSLITNCKADCLTFNEINIKGIDEGEIFSFKLIEEKDFIIELMYSAESHGVKNVNIDLKLCEVIEKKEVVPFDYGAFDDFEPIMSYNLHKKILDYGNDNLDIMENI
ncbi:hypothetical protein ACFL1H_08365 [Nanoarchaeota archaeon]